MQQEHQKQPLEEEEGVTNKEPTDASPPKKAKTHPRKPSKLLTTLTLVSIVLTNIGFWTSEDFPQDLGDHLINHFQITTKEIGTLYSISFLTTVVIAPATGLLITRFGVANIGMLFTFIQTLGTLTMFLAVRTSFFPLLLLGRFTFALGGESTLIAQATASEKWFSGNILSLAMGLNLSMGMVASSLSNFINPLDIVKVRDLEAAFFYYACAASLSFFSMSFFAFLDLRLESGFGADSEGLEGDGEGLEGIKEPEDLEKGLLPSQSNQNPEKQKIGKIEENHKNEAKELQSHSQELKSRSEEPKNGSNEASSTQNYKFKISHLTKMGALFWCACGIYSLAANSYYQFTLIATNLVVHRFGYTFLQAKNVLSAIQLVSAVFIPLNSLIILKNGKKAKMLLIAIFLLLAAYANLVTCPASPGPQFELSVALMMVFYVLYQSSIYPCLALSMPKQVVSIGFGISSPTQAVPLSTLSYLIGLTVKEETQAEYQRALIFLLILTIFSTFLVIYANLVDKRVGGLLDAPENSKQAEQAMAGIQRRFDQRISAKRTGKAVRSVSAGSGFGTGTAATIRAGTTTETEFGGSGVDRAEEGLKEVFGDAGEDDIE